MNIDSKENERLYSEAEIAKVDDNQSWYGDIVKVRSDRLGTTITIDLRPREDRLIPSAGERVKIT